MIAGRTWTAALLCAAALLAGPRAAVAEQATIAIPRVAVPPRLTTYLTAEPPSGPGEIDGFIQRDPRDGRPSAYRTRVFLSYDQDRLYVVFVCHDDPPGVRARVTRRENSDADDTVSVYLDTFHDRRRAYVFTANPLGVQSERIRTEGQDDDPSFDTLWYSEGAMTPFGYVVRMAIPFRSLRFSGEPLQTWGLAVGRRIQRLNEDAYWPALSRHVQGFVPQFAVARGLERVSPGANLQMTPYTTLAGARTGSAGERSTDTSRRMGLDAKVGLGSAFVLDAAVNPDFSEVESDEPQITLNERFEVLFPERRSFFVENAGYFNTPVPLFFSRRIRNPSGGARVTGKAGGWVTAALAMQDQATPDTTDALTTVGSVRRELGRNGHLGALATLRDGTGSSARAVSLDGRWTLGDTWVVAGQLARTDHREDGDARTGTGLFAQVVRDARHFDLTTQYTDLTPEFSAPLGFIQRVDMRQAQHDMRYQFRPRGGVVAKYGPRVDAFVVWDHRQTLTDWRVRPRFEMEFVGQTSFLVDHARSFERYGGGLFDKRRSTVEFETARSRWWSFSTAYETGTDVNRRPARGQVPFLVDRRTSETAFTVRPGRHLVLTGAYLRTRLRHRDAAVTDRAVLDDDIVRTKVYLHATRALTLRAILDYERVASNPAWSTVRRKQPLSLDLLGSFELNPGTAVYVGYLDRLEPASQAERMPLFPDFRSVGRQAFVKVSWLFRY